MSDKQFDEVENIKMWLKTRNWLVLYFGTGHKLYHVKDSFQ